MSLSKKKKTTRRKKNTQKYKKRVMNGGRSKHPTNFWSNLSSSSTQSQNSTEPKPTQTKPTQPEDGIIFNFAKQIKLNNNMVDGLDRLDALFYDAMEDEVDGNVVSTNNLPPTEYALREMIRRSHKPILYDTKYETEEDWEDDHKTVPVELDEFHRLIDPNKVNSDGIPYSLMYKTNDKPCKGEGPIFNYRQYCTNLNLLKLILKTPKKEEKKNKNKIDKKLKHYKSVIEIPELEYICIHGEYQTEYENEEDYNTHHPEKSHHSDLIRLNPNGINKDGILINLLYRIPKNNSGLQRLFTYYHYKLNLPELKYITRIRGINSLETKQIALHNAKKNESRIQKELLSVIKSRKSRKLIKSKSKEK